MTRNSITILPDEVIEHVLEDQDISFLDVIRFASTCKHFYKTFRSSNNLWKTKFFQRWPLLKEIYEENNKCKNRITHSWMKEIKASLKSRQRLLEELTLISKIYYKKEELSDSELKNFNPLFRPEEGAHPFALHFLVDELISLINRPPIVSNLTEKYYALKVVRYLNQKYLTEEWKRFINLPAKEQILERGATIVAQWNQPERHVSYRHISSLLNDIADQTKKVLKEQYPAHSIFATPVEILNLWKSTNIDDNQWSKSETRQIMDALRYILFDKLGFHGNNEMYYSSENLFIDRVLELKRGIPITLAIIFESVARRLGVRCEAISFPSHFLLRWKEAYNTSEDVENFYIDVFNGGQLLTKNNCPRVGTVSRCPIEKYNVHSAATAIEVVQRMADNLDLAARQYIHLNGRSTRILSALELRHMIEPHNTEAILHLGRFYMFHQMDLTEIMNKLQNIYESLEQSRTRVYISQMIQQFRMYLRPQETVETKCRTPAIKYAIGLIMKNKVHGYLCVIVGWDLSCEISTEWITDTSNDELIDGPSQPYYNVLTDNGCSRYLAQENILVAPNPEWVNHYEIGRYFDKFAGTHYIPNEQKAEEYPGDAEVRDAWVRLLK